MTDSLPQKRPRIPNPTEFSPGQLDLLWVLTAVSEFGPDYAAVREAIRQYYFLSTAPTKTGEARLIQQVKRAGNVLSGMADYGLCQRVGSANIELTEVGRTLLAATSDSERFAVLARHLLLECCGLDVLDCIRALQSRNERVTKDSLRDELKARGFEMSTNTQKHTTLLNWLAKSGVVNNYLIDEDRLKTVIGTDSSGISELASLSDAQLVFVKALLQTALARGNTWQSVKSVTELAADTFGFVFAEGNRRAAIYRPLQDGGWVELGDTGHGRGGKSGSVRATERLLTLDAELLDRLPNLGIPPDLQQKLGMPLSEVMAMLKSTSTYEKGLALELLALRIVTDLGLVPRGFRLRSRDAGNVEADLIAEGAHLLFSRWMVQCKNTAHVGVADLAREVGLAVLHHAHVVVMVTTGRFAKTVVAHAASLAQHTHLQVVLLDSHVLQMYDKRDTSGLRRHFHDCAAEAMRLKRTQVGADDTGPQPPREA